VEGEEFLLCFSRLFLLRDPALRPARRGNGGSLRGVLQRCQAYRAAAGRFLTAIGAATKALQARETQAERERDRRLTNIERIKQVILSGGAGPTTGAMLREEEAQLARAEAEVQAGVDRRMMRLLMKPPEEIVRALQVEGFYERRQAIRTLVARVELQSIRQGTRWTEKWIGHIEPVPTAGIIGLPEVIIGRKEFYLNRAKRRTAPCKTPGFSATAPWSCLL